MVIGQTKKCPVCEGNLSPGVKTCPKCGSDVSLPSSTESGQASASKRNKSLDEILASILDEPAVKPSGKKEALDFLDLDLPAEPKSHPSLELDLTEEAGKGAAERSTFECPGCGTEVDESAPQCPSCGALFAEGEEFACPVCGTNVPLHGSSCPSCGVQFEEESGSRPRGGKAPERAQRRSLIQDEPLSPEVMEAMTPRSPASVGGGQVPRAGPVVRSVMERYNRQRGENPLLVGDMHSLQASLGEQVEAIRSLVSMANRLRVPVENTQRTIAAATKKARSRDLPGAVKLAWTARYSLEQSLAIQVAQRLEILQGELSSHRSQGRPYPVAEALVQDSIQAVTQGQLAVSLEKLQLAEDDISSRTSGQGEAHYSISAAEHFIGEVDELSIGMPGAHEVLRQGRDALRAGDYETASRLAGSAKERAMEGLKKGIAEEMRRAREVVIELKMRGLDVSGPINILKQASACTREESFAEAMRYLKLFKQQVQVH